MRWFTMCVAAAALLVAAVYWRRRREGFVSERARKIHADAKPMFQAKDGRPPYRDFKQAVPDGDPVQYDKMKDLWRKNQFTPENVQKIL